MIDSCAHDVRSKCKYWKKSHFIQFSSGAEYSCRPYKLHNEYAQYETFLKYVGEKTTSILYVIQVRTKAVEKRRIIVTGEIDIVARREFYSVASRGLRRKNEKPKGLKLIGTRRWDWTWYGSALIKMRMDISPVSAEREAVKHLVVSP